MLKFYTSHAMWKRITATVLLLCMVICSSSVMLAAFAEEGDTTYVAPDYLIDLVDPEKSEAAFKEYARCSSSPVDEGTRIIFADAGDGTSNDPYIYFNLPASTINCEEYPYFAMIVKTNKSDIRGELRFSTTTTGEYFPCQAVNYIDSDEWQLVVCNLTDLSTVYYSQNTTPYTGNYTRLRLDMFDNTVGTIPANTQYYIKAAAFYKTAEEAATFINFKSSYTSEEETFDVNYADFWLGEEFENPDLSKRMYWLSYGFDGNTSPVDKFLSEGYGGICSNIRFNQNYLKDPNEFAILKKVYDYALEKGMTLWIYDEYQYPSGKAYGLVLDAQPGREWESTGVKHLTFTGTGGTASYTVGSTYGANVEIGVMQAILTDDSGTRNLTVGESGNVAALATGEWTLDVYLLRYNYEGEEDRSDFRTLRDVDLLNPDAMKYFIEITYQQYHDRLGDTFDFIEAFFTDEPNLGNVEEIGYIPWTKGLGERFYETYGYQLNIPSLFNGFTDYDKMVRLNYYQLVADMFKESFIDQIADWCEANGTASSGHLLLEENFNHHIEVYGGNLLQTLGGMTIPGSDALWVDPDNLLSLNCFGSFMGLNYTYSAAKNEGKRDVLVEYNPAVFDSFNDLEDRLGASIGGLSIMRLLGTNKYVIINPQYSYSNKQINKLNTYIGRLNTILDETVECGDLAVFYPIATAQSLYYADKDQDVESYVSDLNYKYQMLCRELNENQYRHTIIDDESICASTVTGDGRMVIGLGSYSVIVVPYTEYMSVEALEKLEEFIEAGGTVAFVNSDIQHGLLPDQEDEVKAIVDRISDKVVTASNTSVLFKKIGKQIYRNITAKVTSGSANRFMMADFESEDRDVSFLVNTTDTEMTIKWNYTDGYDGKADIYYPGSGNIQTVDMSEGVVTVVIPAYEGILIVREDDNTPEEITTEETTEEITEETTDVVTEETTEVVDETTVGQTEKPAKKGCGSTFGGSAMAVVSLCVALGAVASKRKKRK